MNKSLTCLTVNPKEHAGEIRAEAEERFAQVRAIAALAKSLASGGFVEEIDAQVFGAIETLAGQGAQLLAAVEGSAAG